jgi:hypothetical protein
MIKDLTTLLEAHHPLDSLNLSFQTKKALAATNRRGRKNGKDHEYLETVYFRGFSAAYSYALWGQEFLPLGTLDSAITRESVQVELPWTRVLQRGLTNKAILQAKKVFAILMLIGKPLAITELLKKGLIDEDLPFFRKGSDNDKILLSVRGKSFRSFEAWKREAQVHNFLDKQWIVQALVLDTTGKHFTRCERG